MPTLTVRPNSYTTPVYYSAFTVSNAQNIYDNSASTQGPLSMTGTTYNEPYDISFKFNCSALPVGASIDSVSITWTGASNYADRLYNTYMQARYGSNNRGSQTRVSDSNSVKTTTITGLSYTRTELINDFNLLFHSEHGANTNVGYYYLYDVYAVISYTEYSTNNVTLIKDANTSTISPVSQDVIESESCSITATPSSGCVFKGWYSDSSHTNLVSSSNPYTFTPSSDITLYTLSLHKPVISVLSQDRPTISDEASFDRCTATFSSDTALSTWEARATIPSVTPARGVGLLVESGTSLPAATSASIYIDNEELTTGDYTYTISVYGKSTDGCWSDGTIESP